MVKYLKGKETDLGEFSVVRVLPNGQQRMVGPYFFFDHMGPAVFQPGQGINVRPHPHIGLATVTYLFEGSILHRDSVGSYQEIKPGDLNWMTAGKGIVHSERETEEVNNSVHHLNGLQLWIALPEGQEEVDPEFHHHPAATLPEFEVEGVHVRLMIGDVFGKSSPVTTFSPTVYLDYTVKAGQKVPLPQEAWELGLYSLEGRFSIDGEEVDVNQFVYLDTDERPEIKAIGDARIALLGGEPLGSHRYAFWNFVHSSKERLEQAKEDWAEGRFPKVPGDEEEFIPLPEPSKVSTK